MSFPKLQLRNAAPDSEYSVEFLEGMLNRMAVSHFKYGKVEEGMAKIDAIISACRHIEQYADDNNTEHLVDAANFLMMEFMFPANGGKFTPTGTEGSIGRVTVDGVVTQTPNNEIGATP